MSEQVFAGVLAHGAVAMLPERRRLLVLVDALGAGSAEVQGIAEGLITTVGEALAVPDDQRELPACRPVFVRDEQHGCWKVFLERRELVVALARLRMAVALHGVTLLESPELRRTRAPGRRAKQLAANEMAFGVGVEYMFCAPRQAGQPRATVYRVFRSVEDGDLSALCRPGDLTPFAAAIRQRFGDWHVEVADGVECGIAEMPPWEDTDEARRVLRRMSRDNGLTLFDPGDLLGELSGGLFVDAQVELEAWLTAKGFITPYFF